MRRTEKTNAPVLLIQSGYDVHVTRDPTCETPIGLASLAAYCSREGIESDIFDFQVEGDMAFENRIAEDSLQLVGLSASTMQIFRAADQARRIKATRPDVVTVLGGIHASALPNETLSRFDSIDYVAVGEGEQTLAELARAVLDGRSTDNIPGLAKRDNGGVSFTSERDLIEDLDSLPLPDRSLLHLDRYIPKIYAYRKFPASGLLASRGCPYQCRFCSVRKLYRKRFRYCTEDWLLEDIRKCVTDHNIRDFWFYDDTLNVPKGRINRISKAIIKEGTNIYWSCFGRPEGLDKQTLRLMKKSGCFMILFGFEVGETDRMKQIGKGNITTAGIKQVVREAKEAGIATFSNFVLGFPGESATQAWNTVRFARELNLDIFTYTTFYPFAGAPLTEELYKKGQLEPYLGLFPKFNLRWLYPEYVPDPNPDIPDIQKRRKKYERILLFGFLYCMTSPKWIWRKLLFAMKHPHRAIRLMYLSLWRFSYRFVLSNKTC